jgi:hypothetical protein
VQITRKKVAHGLGDAAGPAEYEFIDLGGGPQAHVHVHVVRGKVARRALGLQNRDVLPPVNLEPGANPIRAARAPSG